MVCSCRRRALTGLASLSLAVACETGGDEDADTNGSFGSGGDDGSSVSNLTIDSVDGSGDSGEGSSGDDDDDDDDSTGSTGAGSDTGDETAGTGDDDDDDATGGTADTGGSTGDDASAPSVASLSPDNLDSGVPGAALVAIAFDEAMDPATLTTNDADDSCSGTIQVSADDFATCVQMSGPPSTGDDITFSVGPASLLESSTVYRVRVLDEATDAGGTPMAEDFTTPDGFEVRYFHTIEIDGDNDFNADEAFETSSGAAHTGYVAWNDSHITFGMQSPDVATSNAEVWFVVYIGGAVGSNEGVTYNTQTPTLPFEAQYHVRWRADDGFTGALEWDGDSWATPGWTINPGDVFHTGDFVEIRIDTIDLGSPQYVPVVMGILRETALDEASWGGVPSGAYDDGYDPDFAVYYEFDLMASATPGEYSTSP